MNEFYQKDIISIKDYSKEQLEKIFTFTDKIMQLDPIQRREICKGKTLGYLFYEPSTRTRLSFDSAMASIGVILWEFQIFPHHQLKKVKVLLIQ